ncbi:MAG: sugar-transfer associated ATP-grasp domain-containing protein, partial [Dongiaceae bacterium]
ALFVSYLRREMIAVRAQASDVGDLARYLFAHLGLFKKQHYPRVGNFALPGAKFGLSVARFFKWFYPFGPRVRDKFQRSLWRQFLDICAMEVRHDLDAQAYYMLELYRDQARARAAGYLTRWETKNGLFKVLTWQVSKSRRRTKLGDKLALHRICEEHHIPSVPILMIAEDGNLEFCCERPGLERDLFLKPRQSKGARGTEVIRYCGGRFTGKDGVASSYEGLLERIAQRSKDGAVLVQPWIKNHSDLADLADQSLIPVRVITCLDDSGMPVVTHGMLRVLGKLEPGWPTKLELGAPVDLQSGVLGMMTGDKAAMIFDWYENHPVTHAKVLGRRLHFWSEIRSVALAAHAACKDRLVVGWDIAVGPDGPLLLEGNSYVDVDFLQRVHRCPIGASPLGPLLFFRLRDIECRAATGTLRGPLDYDRLDRSGPDRSA